uniref:alpha/beta hydrolase n=1 Tax=Pseudonocardia lacus TaxID=2835865 RepID=UPI001BDD6883
EHERLAGRFRRAAGTLTALGPALGRAADAVADLRRDLAEIDAVAAAHGLRIDPDGTVTAPAPALPWLPADPLAAELTASLTDILRRADELDATLAAVLTAAADVPTTEALPAPPGADAAPDRNAAWWASLTPAQQQRLLRTDPDLVGDRDGLPAAARDEANRSRLDTEAARTAEAIAATTARLADSRTTDPTLVDHLADLHDRRDALTTVADTLAADTTGRHLLLLDVDDVPRAAVAVGDATTADHVAVHAPGSTTTVADSLPAVTHELTALREHALNQLTLAGRPDATVATVAWLGSEVPGPDAALTRFVDGLTATRPHGHPVVEITGQDLSPGSPGQHDAAATIAGHPRSTP